MEDLFDHLWIGLPYEYINGYLDAVTSAASTLNGLQLKVGNGKKVSG